MDAARNWLMQMGQGAEQEGMKLFYCMALPREILQTSEIPPVTKARVSGDYMLSMVGRSTYF